MVEGERRDVSVSARLDRLSRGARCIAAGRCRGGRRRHGRRRGAAAVRPPGRRTARWRERVPFPAGLGGRLADAGRVVDAVPIAGADGFADPGRRGGPRRRRWRRAARHLPRGRPDARRAAPLRGHGRGPRRRARADAGPRQDLDGRLPRRDTRARHSMRSGLGLSVSLSHTVGILVLAAVVVGAADVLPPDVVVRWAPVVAAVSIVAIGGWMLAGELRRRRSTAAGRQRPRTSTAITVTSMRTRTTTLTTTTTTTTAPRPRSRARARRPDPQPRPGSGLDDHLAQPVRARPRRRPHPVDQRAADPARLDRGRAPGLRVRARRRVRARDGGGDGRHRAGDRRRPRPARAGAGGPRPRSRPRGRPAGRGGARLRLRDLPHRSSRGCRSRRL